MSKEYIHGMHNLRVTWQVSQNSEELHKYFMSLFDAFDFRRDLLTLGGRVGVFLLKDGEWGISGSGFVDTWFN